MGESILASILQNGLYSSDTVSVIEADDEKRKNIGKTYGVRSVNADDIPIFEENYEIVIVAVKPQNVETIIPLLKKLNFKSLTTILAGVKCSFFTDALGKIPVIRVMPNICIKVSKSVTGIYTGKNSADIYLIKKTEKIFQTCGTIIRLKNEDDIDKLTAISGSGPAYVAYMVEALIHAAKSLGFSKLESEELAIGTFDGSIQYLKQTKETAEELRKKVTSPGGTTEKAIQHYDEKKIKKIIKDAVEKAFLRAQELGKQNDACLRAEGTSRGRDETKGKKCATAGRKPEP